MNASNDPYSSLPLTEATYFILLSLAPEPRHGYAIMKNVHLLSHGRVSMSTGTLYSALKRLLDQDWIRRADEFENGSNGRHRKAYHLTDLGQRILAAEIQRLEGLVGAAQRHISAGTAAGSLNALGDG
jgi:DNA-binding PadR family transcriptional regulator